jgi:hypothetical protein
LVCAKEYTGDGADAQGNPRLFDIANQWAGSLGGAIKKDKLFFFFDTEGIGFEPLVDNRPSFSEGDSARNLQFVSLIGRPACEFVKILNAYAGLAPRE